MRTQYQRPATLVLAATLLLTGPGCSDELVEIPEELRGDPYCALIIGTYGHYDDDNRWMIVNYATGFVAAGCICATASDIASGARDDELNDAALAECRAQAATKDFVWDECQIDYEAREWLDVIIRAEGDDAHIKPPALRCVPDKP
jgi:hypothetical protein